MRKKPNGRSDESRIDKGEASRNRGARVGRVQALQFLTFFLFISDDKKENWRENTKPHEGQMQSPTTALLQPDLVRNRHTFPKGTTPNLSFLSGNWNQIRNHF